MWKDFSFGYIKNNRASGISILAAAFISALFLSLLCSLFYNFWLDNVEGTKQEDGDWHGRITGELTREDLAEITYFANVEQAVLNEELTQGQMTVVDVYFFNKRTIYRDMTALLRILELPEEAADYNYQLLSLYFIRIPGDETPRMLMPAYLAIVALVCVSLILVIHNSFAVSMNSRIHQFGILSSIGAAPGQILTCLLQEALVLSVAPIFSGILLGSVISFWIVRAMSAYAANLVGGRQMPFSWHPGILAVVFLLSVLTVLISAWIPAVRLSKLTPLEAIRGTEELQIKKRGILFNQRFCLLSAVFGMEGELAQTALRAQKKALRTTSLSLTLAFLGFMLIQCFFTLSRISTNHTYFEAYQDVWDVMVTVKDTRIEAFEPLQEVQEVEDVRSSVIYQMADAAGVIPADQISPRLQALGGLEAVAGSSVSAAKNAFLIKAPLVILDDKGFGAYCKEIGIEPKLDGSILLNRIWDSKNSNFRYKEYIPYLEEDHDTILLQSMEQEQNQVELPVLAYTQECPALREEYDNYALVNIIPLSLWETIAGQIGGVQKNTYIRVLAEENTDPVKLSELEDQIAQIIGDGYEIESENRLQEKISNDEMIRGYQLLLGGFCVLLAVIGIAHVFSNTLGFLRQRKREFARYQSVGLTPEGMRNVFCIEALLIAGRPMLAALILTIAAMAAMIKISYLDPMEFLLEAPAVPILLFVLAVFGFVALAYYLGAKKIQNCSLADALRNDSE